jgi:excisionase family DNA binding protein
MQQISSVLSSREAGRVLDVDATTIQRAIVRGELNASRKREHSPYRIQRSDLLAWAAANGIAALNAEGERVDVSTGEVLADNEPATAPAPPVNVADARARLAGVPAGQFANADYTREPRFDSPRVAESNVAQILLPSADAGLLEAARRLVQLPESPELWQALRAVLGVGA